MIVRRKLKDGTIKEYFYGKHQYKNYHLDAQLKNICRVRGLKTDIKNGKYYNRIIKTLGRFIQEDEVFDNLDYIYIKTMSDICK